MLKLKEYGTNVRTEVIAGLTMFAAMAYIIPVNAAILGQTGIPGGAVVLATCIAAAAGSLLMALWANVPYGMAPGMGLNAFFTFTVVFALGFSWKQALAMVFLSGAIDLIVTATGIRKHIVASLPKTLRSAMGVGIGLFIAYIGIKDAGLLSFTSDPGTYACVGAPGADCTAGTGTIIAGAGAIPAIQPINTTALILAVIAIALTIVLYVLKVKGAILISIVAMTIVGAFFGFVHMDFTKYLGDLGASFGQLGSVFGQALIAIPSLFTDPTKIVLAIATIFAFSLTGLFDELGTSLGLGRATGIFSEEEIEQVAQVRGFKTRFARSLVPPSIATMFGALFGTSNTTTYIESSAGIAAGGKTGATALTTSSLFLASILLAPLAMAVPSFATAPALIMVGALMIRPVREIDWTDPEAAIPAFLAIVVMPFAYSITTGIAVGVIFYCLIKLVRGKFSQIHPVLAVIALLFVAYFVNMALGA